MLVARSFQYTTPRMDPVHDKSERRTMRRSSSPTTQRNAALAADDDDAVALAPKRTPTEPVAIPSAKSAHSRPSSRMQQSAESRAIPSFKGGAMVGSGRRKVSSAHDPNALSPSVAALLAVTAIPPRRPNRYQKRLEAGQRISIEELISEWKSDDSLKPSYGSSPVLSALLEDADDADESPSRNHSAVGEMFLQARSASSESIPSLEADDRSILSGGSPSTPGSLRSRRSISNLRKPRPVQTVQDAALDHPLVPHSDLEDEHDHLHSTALPFTAQKREPEPTKSRSSFKSNLTASLQNLKNAAISSITSLGGGGGGGGGNSSSNNNNRHRSHPANSPPIDHVLWSHPFLFPHFSSEIRPATDGHISEAQRRYLNPMPLTFEEQEAPFQQALHAPYLAESLTEYQCAPRIPMQTYTRGGAGGRRGRGASSSSRRAAARHPAPNSEAGRALLGPEGARHREVRENSDFLRVVVLEMNMRREGKLESGRARIWLPPREETLSARGRNARSRVPSRWVGVSAYAS